MVFVFEILVLHCLYLRLADRSASARGKSKGNRGPKCTPKRVLPMMG